MRCVNSAGEVLAALRNIRHLRDWRLLRVGGANEPTARDAVRGAHARGRDGVLAMTAQNAAANRYLNLIRNKAKRDYGFAYLSWLKNGAVGHEPERGKLSCMAAQAVRNNLHEILGPEPFIAVGAHQS